MILARGVLAAVLSAGTLAFAAERAVADHIGHSLPTLALPTLALPSLEPAGLVFAATSVDDMTPEMRRAYIRGIQEELAAHSYDPGPADGLLGPMTHTAIRKYQREAGLRVDGVASKELLDHLKFAQPRTTAKPDPEPDPLVLEVQTRLQALGYHRGVLDGLMGGTTRESIRAYRYDAGLPISGAVDGPLLESLRPIAIKAAAIKEAAINEAAAKAAEAGAETSEEPLEETWREPAPEPELLPVTPPPAE
jgi:peptidoglycan hydrolase-like protein with peptidoglycan-binding domain